MIITSKDNDFVKHLKKLKEKKYRDEYNEFIIEGIKIVKEAIEENQDIVNIVMIQDIDFDIDLRKYNDKVVIVSKNIFDTISDVKSPQGIMAIISKKSSQDIDYNQSINLILDDVQDPGNIGTIIRTADSLNIKQIIVSKGTADVYNPKVVRSTMGAIFRVKILEQENLTYVIEKMKKNNITVYATDLEGAESIYNVDYKKAAIIIGNEANGVSEPLKKIADKRIKIPMIGKTESLNAAVATSIILYEAHRKNGLLQ